MLLLHQTLVVAAFCAISLCTSAQVPAVAEINVDLRRELLSLRELDQAARAAKPLDAQRLREVDAKNTARLREIIATYGWPAKSLVGEDGAAAAWLLAQHADQDLNFQRRVLTLIEPLALRDEVSITLYAYLYDRTHRPQRYGTQGTCVANGVWEPREIEDPVSVDSRRAEAKITPVRLSEYAALVGDRSCRK